MQLSVSEEQQDEMRHAHFDGAPGILVSGLVWLTAALVCQLLGMHRAVWTLLIGGALIYPISAILTKVLGRPAKTSKANALNQLGMASTIWLILCCAMAYGLYLFQPTWFFPAMMVTIGSRYLGLCEHVRPIDFLGDRREPHCRGKCRLVRSGPARHGCGDRRLD